jgi:hypothetical protein
MVITTLVADLASWCCAANQVGCRSRCGAHVDVDEVVCPARGANGARKKSNIQYMSILFLSKMQLSSLQGFKRMDISGYLSCVHWSTIYELVCLQSNNHTPNCIDHHWSTFNAASYIHPNLHTKLPTAMCSDWGPRKPAAPTTKGSLQARRIALTDWSATYKSPQIVTAVTAYIEY